ncbi:hypothetical protein [Psychrobacillus phage Perkons]|nr:hypothetical protein [Psychrobacillus phage Perkons]
MTRYKKDFKFFDTEHQAKTFCDNENLNRYIRINHTATYTNWTSEDGKEKQYLAWYVHK